MMPIFLLNFIGFLFWGYSTTFASSFPVDPSICIAALTNGIYPTLPTGTIEAIENNFNVLEKDAYTVLTQNFNEIQAWDIFEDLIRHKTSAISWPSPTTYNQTLEGAIVTRNEWLNWTSSDLAFYRGKTLKYEPALKDFKVSQKLLFLEDFAKAERNIIRILLRNAKKKKFTRRDLAQNERVKRDPTLRAEDQEFIDRARRLGKEHSIEFGMWKIELDSGRTLQGKMTSSALRRVNADDTRKAMNGILRKGIRFNENVTAIKYFHIHPINGAPLSQQDIFSILNLRRETQRMGMTDRDTRFTVYAISRIENTPIIYEFYI